MEEKGQLQVFVRCRERGAWIHCWQEQKSLQPLWKTLCCWLKKLNLRELERWLSRRATESGLGGARGRRALAGSWGDCSAGVGPANRTQGSHPADQEETLPSLYTTEDSRRIEGLNANYKTTAMSTEDVVFTCSPGAEKSLSRRR